MEKIIDESIQGNTLSVETNKKNSRNLYIEVY